MKKFAIAIGLLTSTLLFTQAVFAQDATNSTTSRTTAPLKREVDQQKIDTGGANHARKENIQDKMAIMKEKMASREAALKLKLQTFRDQRKATAAARISDNLNKINTNQTSQMQKYLANMSLILDKLENRVNSNTADIKNVAAAKDAIAKSRATIASASAAVTLQSQRDYTITVTSEAKVKQDAQKMREQLHTDLLSLRKLVIDAKQSVSNAIRVTKSGKVEIPGKKEGTVSGQQ